MTLDPSTLSSALAELLAGLPETAADAADGMAAAYFDYASAGMFGPSTPVLTSAHKDALAATLLSAIAVPAAGLPATIAGAWSAGVAAFWLAVPVAGPMAGATVGCPGAASLVASLTVVFANLANTAESCALSLATALHAATLTVTANVAPPPGTVLPIS